ncbi:MAG: hypothetical protein ABSA92_15040 [Candidatus Bathyarchaeia archaeon]|jgi:hypothetical protein
MDKRIKIVLAALIVRVAIAPFFMHAGDLGTIYESSAIALNGGNLYNFVYQQTVQMQYATGLPVFFEGYAYHPLLIYFFVPFYWVYTLIAGPGPAIIGGHFPSLPVLVYPWTLVAIFMLKIPIILADVAVVYILSGFDIKKAEIYAFCPYIIFISAVWGMFDAIIAVFLLLSYLTFNNKSSYALSGFTYGLSLMKLYTIVLLPLYVVRLWGKWKDLGKFLLGLLATLIPVAYYWIVSPIPFWNVLVGFQGSRVMGGVNLYNFVWIIPDVRFDLQLSMIPNILLVISVAVIVLAYGRRLPMLEAILAVMLVSFVFGKVLNEQFLVSIFPLMLLCKKCDTRLWIAPFVFIFLRSPFYYFAIPILWGSPYFYDLYFQADTIWRNLQTAGYLTIPMYAIGVSFSLLLLWNLIQVLSTSRPAGGTLSRILSRAIRIRRK